MDVEWLCFSGRKHWCLALAAWPCLMCKEFSKAVENLSWLATWNELALIIHLFCLLLWGGNQLLKGLWKRQQGPVLISDSFCQSLGRAAGHEGPVLLFRPLPHYPGKHFWELAKSKLELDEQKRLTLMPHLSESAGPRGTSSSSCDTNPCLWVAQLLHMLAMSEDRRLRRG